MKTELQLDNKKGIEFSLSFVVTLVIILVVVAVILAFGNVIMKAINGLPG